MTWLKSSLHESKVQLHIDYLCDVCVDTKLVSIAVDVSAKLITNCSAVSQLLFVRKEKLKKKHVDFYG